ncbi:SH3 domain-containing protein [Dichotomocladium elegans]|nr:SH3 domain-containing protein [Dichotomocladium elegans]
MTVYRAKYAYAAQEDDELTLNPGVTVRPVNTENQDWWIVEDLATGKRGMVPTNFLEKIQTAAATSTTPSSSSVLSTVNEGRVLARIIRDYDAQASDQLTLWKNGVITVLEQPNEDWWKGDLNGKIGTFPSDHVKLIDSIEEKDETETKSNRSNMDCTYGRPPN